jgi:hypothetical protein
VLDNLEQLLPEGLELILDLLQHASGVTLLVTSRERLNVKQETVLSLQGLASRKAPDCSGSG